MTIIWFIAWFIVDHIGDRAPLHFAPVNMWAGLLLAAVALDLAASHAPGGKRR